MSSKQSKQKIMNFETLKLVKYTKKVLYGKIGATIALWFIPLLFSPPVIYEFLGIPVPKPDQFSRLLGIAYAALCVAYYSAIICCKYIISFYNEGSNLEVAIKMCLIFLKYILLMGIVSNLGGFLALFVYAVAGTWNNWGILGNIYMYTSLIVLFLISVNLIIIRWKFPNVNLPLNY